MANALNEVYEPRFLGCSYGFRPGRSAHDVVRYINKTIMTHKVNYVMEADKADDKKEGGSYKEVTGIVKKIDAYEKTGLIVKSSWTLE